MGSSKPSHNLVVLGPRRDVAHEKATVGLALHTFSMAAEHSYAPRDDADIHEFERHAFLVEETALDRGVRLERHSDRAAGCFCVICSTCTLPTLGDRLRNKTPRDSFGSIPRISNGATAP